MDTSASPARAFHLLGDPVRWRLLRVLSQEALNVSEATAIVGVAQSGISRHLRLLEQGGILREERRGGWSFFALPPEPPAGLAGLWAPLKADLAASLDVHGDDARLAEVRRERAERGEPEEAAGGGVLEPGRSWAAWSQALGLLLPPLKVLHLGCGAGALAGEIARWAGEVLAVEPDAALAAKARVRLAGQSHVRVVAAPLCAVPVSGAAYELALVAQVLSAVEEPRAVLLEAARLLAPGGRVLVLDLLPHRERWVLERLGHRRLGFTPEELGGLLEDVGFEVAALRVAERRRGNPFVVLTAAGVKPRAAAGSPAKESA